jgi:hypothetical protein
MPSSSKSFFAPAGETGGGSGQNRGDVAVPSTFSDLDWQPALRVAVGSQEIFRALANRVNSHPAKF